MAEHGPEPDAPPPETPPALDLPAARSLVEPLGLEVDRVSAMPGGSRNRSYLFDTPTGRYVCTLLTAHTPASAELLIRLTAYAAVCGIATPAPLLPASGALLPWHGVPVMVRPHVEGSVHAARLPPALLGDAGAALARVHAMPMPPFAPVAVRRLPVGWAEPPLPPALRSFVATGVQQAANAGLFEVSRAVFTHGDLFPDNLIVPPAGPPLIIIDWEFAGADDALLDLGVAVVGLCRSPAGGVDAGAVDALLTGYLDAGGQVEAIGVDGAAPVVHDAPSLLASVRWAATVLAYERWRQRPHAGWWQEMAALADHPELSALAHAAAQVHARAVRPAPLSPWAPPG